MQGRYSFCAVEDGEREVRGERINARKCRSKTIRVKPKQGQKGSYNVQCTRQKDRGDARNQRHRRNEAPDEHHGCRSQDRQHQDRRDQRRHRHRFRRG